MDGVELSAARDWRQFHCGVPACTWARQVHCRFTANPFAGCVVHCIGNALSAAGFGRIGAAGGVAGLILAVPKEDSYSHLAAMIRRTHWLMLVSVCCMVLGAQGADDFPQPQNAGAGAEERPLS